jgi:hypothetical protein
MAFHFVLYFCFFCFSEVFHIMGQCNGDRACVYAWCGRPWGHGPAKHRWCRAVQAWRHGLAEIMNICRSLALRARPMEILWVWGVGVWGSTALAGQRSRARRSEIPWCVEQWLCDPMGWGSACSTGYSFSIWWGREASQELGVQSADVSALPGALNHQACLQLLIKVPGSWRSEGYWLCSSCHLGSVLIVL